MTRFGLVTFALAVLCTQVTFAASTADASLRTITRDNLRRLEISPPFLNFGTVQNGTVIKKWVRIENVGAATTIVHATSGDRDEFQLQCPRQSLALAPGSRLSCKVSFAPRVAGQYRGTINVRYRHRDTEWRWSTTGIHIFGRAEGSTGEISTNPSSINFGSPQVGEPKMAAETLTNNGQAALTISKVVAVGQGFSFTGIDPPLTLSPGQSVSISVIYYPGSSGLSRGTLWLQSNASNSSISIPLEGTALSPGQLRLSSTALNFGNVVVGSQLRQVATLFAAGGPVTLSSVQSNNAEFSIAGPSLPMIIPWGRTASVILTFHPQAPGVSTGTLILNTNATNSAIKIRMAGTGIPALQHSVTLSWEASESSDVVGYNVYRATKSGGPYSRINTAVNSSTTDTDDSVSPGQTYYYVVTGVSSDSQETGYSNEASAKIPSP